MIARVNIKTGEATIIKPLDDADRDKIDDIFVELYLQKLRREKAQRLKELATK